MISLIRSNSKMATSNKNNDKKCSCVKCGNSKKESLNMNDISQRKHNAIHNNLDFQVPIIRDIRNKYTEKQISLMEGVNLKLISKDLWDKNFWQHIVNYENDTLKCSKLVPNNSIMNLKSNVLFCKKFWESKCVHEFFKNCKDSHMVNEIKQLTAVIDQIFFEFATTQNNKTIVIDSFKDFPVDFSQDPFITEFMQNTMNKQIKVDVIKILLVIEEALNNYFWAKIYLGVEHCRAKQQLTNQNSNFSRTGFFNRNEPMPNFNLGNKVTLSSTRNYVNKKNDVFGPQGGKAALLSINLPILPTKSKAEFRKIIKNSL